LVKSHRLNLPHLYWAPPSGAIPLEFRLDFWRQKTKSSWAMVRHCLCGPKFSHFGTMQACDRLTDRHTMTAYTVLA